MSSVAIRRALYGKMAGDSTLTNMLWTPSSGKAIYYQLAPQDAQTPLVIFSQSSGLPTYSFGQGGAPFEEELWLIKGLDVNSTADVVDDIASRLDALLTDGTLNISGRSQMYLRRDSQVSYSETDGGQEFKHSGHLFRLYHQPS